MTFPGKSCLIPQYPPIPSSPKNKQRETNSVGNSGALRKMRLISTSPSLPKRGNRAFNPPPTDVRKPWKPRYSSRKTLGSGSPKASSARKISRSEHAGTEAGVWEMLTYTPKLVHSKRPVSHEASTQDKSLQCKASMTVHVQVFGRRHDELFHARWRPASKKRQGTKSREVWH